MELQSRMGRTESELHRARQEVSHYKNSEARYSTVTIWIPDIQILDIRMPDIVGVWYLNGKVKWLAQPFEYWTFWTMNRLFQSGVLTTTRKLNHFTTRYKSTILNTWLVRYSDGYCTRGTFINCIVQISTVFMTPHFPLIPCVPGPSCIHKRSHNGMQDLLQKSWLMATKMCALQKWFWKC